MKNSIVYILLLISGAATADVAISDIMNVLKFQESTNNPEAVGDFKDGVPQAYGILQIHKGVIEDVNRKYGTSYTHQDAFNEACSEEIFQLYIQMWTEHLKKTENREATVEDVVRIWNGGPRGYKRDGTLNYLANFKKNQYLYTMKENKRKCIINGKLGIVLKSYTHTMDIYICKDKKHMYGVHKRYVKLLPVEKPKIDKAQLTFSYE